MHLDVNAPALEPPSGLTAQRGQLGEDEFVLLEWPDPLDEAPPGLTRAEREVLVLLVGGASNPEIAAARGTSPRTVANQVSFVFRKLGVRSRAELAARGAFARRP